MKKRWIILLIVVAVIIGSYGVFAAYYKNRIRVGTFVNNRYVGATTLSEADDILKKDYEGFTFTITDKEGKTYSFTSEDIDCVAYYGNGLSGYIAAGGLDWTYYAFQKSYYTVEPEIKFDADKLGDKLHYLFDEQLEREYKVSLINDGENLILVNDKVERLDYYKLLETVCKMIKDGVYTLDFMHNDYKNVYTNHEYTAQEKNYMECYSNLQKYRDHKLSIFFGTDEEVIDYETFMQLVIKDSEGLPSFDKNDKLCFDQSKVKSYCSSLAEKYSTLYNEREFVSAGGETKTLAPGTYGNIVAKDKLTSFVLQNLSDVSVTSYETEYSQVNIPGLHDIGKDYVEIDLTNQHMYIFLDGELALDTDIVSGDMNLERDTPAGVFYIYYKEKDVILRGNGYESHVDYWMAIYKGYGIHDASWRKKFGGEEYLSNGSHGCINTPCDVMSKVYEICPKGMPVILYY